MLWCPSVCILYLSQMSIKVQWSVLHVTKLPRNENLAIIFIDHNLSHIRRTPHSHLTHLDHSYHQITPLPAMSVYPAPTFNFTVQQHFVHHSNCSPTNQSIPIFIDLIVAYSMPTTNNHPDVCITPCMDHKAARPYNIYRPALTLPVTPPAPKEHPLSHVPSNS